MVSLIHLDSPRKAVWMSRRYMMHRLFIRVALPTKLRNTLHLSGIGISERLATHAACPLIDLRNSSVSFSSWKSWIFSKSHRIQNATPHLGQIAVMTIKSPYRYSTLNGAQAVSHVMQQHIKCFAGTLTNSSTVNLHISKNNILLVGRNQRKTRRLIYVSIVFVFRWFQPTNFVRTFLRPQAIAISLLPVPLWSGWL